MYEVPKRDVDLLPPYILERAAVQLREQWPWLKEAIKTAKPGDKIHIRFNFVIEVKTEAYDDEGKITAEFITIRPEELE